MPKDKTPGWIEKDEFVQPQSVLGRMYKAYIFNLQEDIWGRIYPARTYVDGCNVVVKQMTALLKLNQKMWNRYIANPTDENITAHGDVVELAVIEMRDTIDDLDELYGDMFRGKFLRNAIHTVYDEFFGV